MGKMSNLDVVLDEMITCGQNLVKAAQELKELFSEEGAVKPQKTASKQLFDPTPKKKEDPKEVKAEPEAKTYTFQEVRGIMASLSGSGKKTEAKALLTKFGASRLSEVKEEDFPALVAEAEAILNG